ncbi:MAG: hypothetical protein EBZ26_06075 [Flavobacteriia bacterium]|nr:hypothetical protein [Flavobacteriia bacterium]
MFFLILFDENKFKNHYLRLFINDKIGIFESLTDFFFSPKPQNDEKTTPIVRVCFRLDFGERDRGLCPAQRYLHDRC